MGDLPQWAMEKARAIVDEMNVDWTGDGRASDAYAREQRRLSIENIARALVEAEARGIERAATHARCAFDDRPRSRDNIDWTDGFDDGTRAAEAAIRKLNEPNGRCDLAT